MRGPSSPGNGGTMLRRLLWGLGLALVAAAGAEACPTCVASMPGEEAELFRQGVLTSTAVLMLVPFSVLFTVLYATRQALVARPAEVESD